MNSKLRYRKKITMTSKRKIILKPNLKVHYRRGLTHFNHVRVWRDGWFHDQFEETDPRDFFAFKTIAEKLGIRFVDHT